MSSIVSDSTLSNASTLCTSMNWENQEPRICRVSSDTNLDDRFEPLCEKFKDQDFTGFIWNLEEEQLNKQLSTVPVSPSETLSQMSQLWSSELAQLELEAALISELSFKASRKADQLENSLISTRKRISNTLEVLTKLDLSMRPHGTLKQKCFGIMEPPGLESPELPVMKRAMTMSIGKQETANGGVVTRVNPTLLSTTIDVTCASSTCCSGFSTDIPLWLKAKAMPCTSDQEEFGSLPHIDLKLCGDLEQMKI